MKQNKHNQPRMINCKQIQLEMKDITVGSNDTLNQSKPLHHVNMNAQFLGV